MDELKQIKQAIADMKETLIFLVEQEKLRGEEVSSLNEKIEAVNSYMMEEIVAPSVEAFKEKDFADFDSKYGERLNKYDDVIRASKNEPEYSSSRAAWNSIQELTDEERADFDEEKFVADAEANLEQYMAELKKTLGLAPDTAVEVTDDGNGNTEVKADTTGDGTPDTVVTEETEVSEGSESDMPEETEEMEIDPELQKELDEYSKKED